MNYQNFQFLGFWYIDVRRNYAACCTVCPYQEAVWYGYSLRRTHDKKVAVRSAKFTHFRSSFDFDKKVLINVATKRRMSYKLWKVTGIADDINGIDGGLMGRSEIFHFWALLWSLLHFMLKKVRTFLWLFSTWTLRICLEYQCLDYLRWLECRSHAWSRCGTSSV